VTETRTYYAVSILSSRTFWVAVLTVGAGLVAEPEVAALIPIAWLPRILIGVGLVNMVLRKLTVRPVVLDSLPGTLTPVLVPKLDPPAPVVTD